MARRNRDPEREAKREKMSNLHIPLKIDGGADKILDWFKRPDPTFACIT